MTRRLSGREKQILRLTLDGNGSEAIARSLGISQGTAKNYISNAIRKTGEPTALEAAEKARREGEL